MIERNANTSIEEGASCMKVIFAQEAIKPIITNSKVRKFMLKSCSALSRPFPFDSVLLFTKVTSYQPIKNK